MFKFGTIPPRVLQSFGVSGLLAENCRIYYDSLFSPRQIGRVSDLIAAQFREAGADELRMRAIVLFGFFEAYRSHGNAIGSEEMLAGSGSLPEPLVIEFGIDDEKIAIGITFRAGIGVDTDGLSERVFQGTPNGNFEQLLAQVYSNSDRLVIRSRPGAQLEVVAYLAISGKIPLEEVQRREPPHVVVMADESDVEPAPKAQVYVQMGDLDYSSLLRADGAPIEVGAPSSGEYLATGCSELEEAIRLRAQAAAIEKKFKVSGSEGKAPGGNDDVVVIKGQKSDLVDNTKMVIQGTAAAESESPEEIVVAAAPVEKPAEKIKGIFKKVWPFKKPVTEELNADEFFNAEEAERPASEAAVADEPASTAESASDPALENFMVEIQDGSLESTIARAQREVDDIKKDMASNRAKRWVEGLMGDLVAEKARLHDMAKKLNGSVRQKELEFRNREQALHEEIRRRDEMVKQKNSALNRTKEQLQQVTTTLEKFKGAAGDRAEEGQFKQKYALSQRLLVSSKDENAKLQAKIEDLKSQLASAQMAIKSRGSSSSSTEVSALKLKHDRVVRQAEELRNMNEQLSARIQMLADRLDQKVGGKESPETTKRLDAAMKQLVSTQKDNEQLKLRLEEVSREEMRLKMELKRSLLELKTLKSRQGGAGGGGSRAA